jgi:aryl-alcohol dehydrogenase-like predicted oxidoreductase
LAQPGDAWSLGEEESRPFIKRALEVGINFFDTANRHSLGSSEEILGRAIKDFARRDEIVIATKVYGRMRPGPNGAGLSKAIMGGVAADGEPKVRIHLSPADSLSLSRFRFRTLRIRLSARVWAAGLTTGSAETRQAFHCAPTGGNVSAGPYSSTAVPLMRSAQCHDGPNEVRTSPGLAWVGL